MDKFFKQENCDRCGQPLTNGRIMSMLNTECICLKCKEAEQQLPEYEEATLRELKEVKKGNLNYQGIKQ